MKIPDSLPWKQSESSTLQDCVEGSDEYIIAERFGSDDDQEYCIKACNNFPEAIEIIKELQQELYLIHAQYGDRLHAVEMCTGLENSENFLNKIENEN